MALHLGIQIHAKIPSLIIYSVQFLSFEGLQTQKIKKHCGLDHIYEYNWKSQSVGLVSKIAKSYRVLGCIILFKRFCLFVGMFTL